MFNYDGRIFRSVSNTDNGDVGEQTLFHYHQNNDIVWAEYSGGVIIRGMLIAQLDDNGILDMRYQHITSDGNIMTGKCQSTPEILSDGRYRLHEKWQWTSGDKSSGESIVEEITST